jgi:hypothetical protein
MEPITCRACGYEFDKPARTEVGCCCPRCAEPVAALAGFAPHALALETVLSAAFGGIALGLIAAAILFVGRW